MHGVCIYHIPCLGMLCAASLHMWASWDLMVMCVWLCAGRQIPMYRYSSSRVPPMIPMLGRWVSGSAVCVFVFVCLYVKA